MKGGDGMNLRDLMDLELMKKARVIAGEQGLDREVTWCAPDHAFDEDNWVMPGLLYLYTGKTELGLEENLDRLEDDALSGVLMFIDEGEELPEGDPAYFDEHSLPLIAMSRGTNPVNFMKRFAAALSTRFSNDFRKTQYIRELAADRDAPRETSYARALGYNSNFSYYCILVCLKGDKSLDPVAIEMEANRMRDCVLEHFSLEDAKAFGYVENGDLLAFIPCPGGNNLQRLRSSVQNAALSIHRMSSLCRWQIFVGSSAESLKEFHTSFIDALATRDVIETLNVHEKASFYEDWYMHMLLFKEPRNELREHMKHTLGPILDSPDLLDTLINYLVFGENLKVTSQKMYIHVNTLKYRLKRISEILGVDLHDPNTRFRLRMAVTIERYLADGPSHDEADSTRH
jgi:hypothetical protein